ncbi:unnamed protein product, partial [Adineta steineri]
MPSFLHPNEYVINENESYKCHRNGRRIAPRLVDYLDDGHEDVSPVIWIGLLGTQPVYRVTNTLGLDREGNNIEDFEIHWPAIFPDIIIPMCDPLQLDITIRNH